MPHLVMDEPPPTDLADDFARQLRRLRTRRSYTRVVRRLFAGRAVTESAVREVRPEDVIAFLEDRRTNRGKPHSQSEALQPTTLLSYLNALRRFYAWLTQEGIIAPDQDPTRSEEVEQWMRAQQRRPHQGSSTLGGLFDP